MKKSLVIAVVGMLVAACQQAPTAPGPDASRLTLSGVVASATGSGHFDDDRFDPAKFRSFTFTVKEFASGRTVGEFQLNNRNFPIRVHGELECVSISASGDEAWFAGPTTVSDDPDQIGVIRVFRVIDNGEGSGADADEVSFAGASDDAQSWCDDQEALETTPIEAGNVQVH